MIVIDMDMPTDCVDCPIECFPYGGEESDYSTTKRPSFCCIKCDIEDIKAEIKEKRVPIRQIDTAEMHIGNCFRDFNRCINEVLDIIDKYTAESEEQTE